MVIDEFAVREVLGVTSVHTATHGESCAVRLNEGDHRMSIVVAKPSGSDPAELTPDQARRLARQLYRLARRIDRRNAA
jgi:hypothetical protein